MGNRQESPSLRLLALRPVVDSRGVGRYRDFMPTVCRFYGMIIQMYYNDHDPPHFHVIYNEFKAVIAINDLSVLFGDLPPKAIGLVMEWARTRKSELLHDWNLGKQKQPLEPISPLEKETDMYFDVKKAEAVGGYVVKLEFEDGSTGMVDLSKYLEEGTVFTRLSDPAYFKTLRVEYGTLVWGEGEVDVAPEALYEDATGKAVDYRSKNRAVS